MLPKTNDCTLFIRYLNKIWITLVWFKGYNIRNLHSTYIFNTTMRFYLVINCQIPVVVFDNELLVAYVISLRCISTNEKCSMREIPTFVFILDGISPGFAIPTQLSRENSYRRRRAVTRRRTRSRFRATSGAKFSAKASQDRASWPERVLLRKLSPSTPTCTERWGFFLHSCNEFARQGGWSLVLLRTVWDFSFTWEQHYTTSCHTGRRGARAEVSAALFCHCAAGKSAGMSQKERPNFYRQELNKTVWEVPERYQNLSPVGSGAYGSVW